MGSLPSPPLESVARIYACFAGEGGNWVEYYTPSDNTWRCAGSIPGVPPGYVIRGFALVSLGPFLYLLGGRIVRLDGEIDLAARADVLRLDTATGEWALRAPLLFPRADFAAAAAVGRIFAAGGIAGDRRGTAAAEAYDPAADRWDSLPPMGTHRYKCAGVAWAGRFHVVGGFTGSAPAVVFAADRSSAEAYDAGRDEWAVRPGMWALDVPPNQIVAVGTRLLSSGDCLNTWKGHVEAYDGKLNMWNIVEGSQLEELSSPAAYLTMAAVGTRLYFLAGYRPWGGDSRVVSVVHVFDTADATWSRFEPVKEGGDDGNGNELCGHCCVVQL